MASRESRPPHPVEPRSWAAEAPKVRLAWISKPRAGETANGDAVVMRQYGASALIVVIDALGHGPNAAKVADAAVDWVGAAPEGERLETLVPGLHHALAGLRGAAALMFMVAPDGIQTCSVGNVALRSTSGKLPFVLTPGVFGQRLRAPKFCTTVAPLSDRFVLFSDGISGRFDLKEHTSLSPEALAVHLFAKHRHSHDDSTVVVVDVQL